MFKLVTILNMIINNSPISVPWKRSRATINLGPSFGKLKIKHFCTPPVAQT